ncbi:MAG: radical SAM family heme chaperone HemW [Alphaproteobacteria bacterium]|nr:radical SAM family heme chaperone HemW [Alphaproteobacteria bacterium]
MPHRDENTGFGLYIHWPFCRSKCPYCDFNSHVEGVVDQQRWRRAMLAELDHIAETVGRRPLTSIFFGGGTPSLMDPGTVAALIERASARFGYDQDIEITLEANPTSAEKERLADFRAAGVNRLSLGVQSLDDDALRFLGREHGADEARDALDHAARLFPRYSFDLIYARPGQTPDAWARELDRALGHACGHLSVYQLTIEPGTRFFTLHQRGDLTLPEDDLQADLFELTREKLSAAGLPPYEISNHAAEGEACRHNLTYWRAGDYAGIGPGAHGRLTIGDRRFATSTARMPCAWLERVEASGHGELPREPIAIDEQVIEMLLMGLRLEEGVDVARLERMSGRPLRRTLNAEAIDAFTSEGWIIADDRNLRATATGLARLNAILGTLLEPAAAIALDGCDNH